ncbi:TIGR02117 family protein [Rhodocytophaga aerolata]|uniref:TIGR02117 family protein n=1 Tax=Rhodocytophaga aerolata TaxID=455078 RepID=A0ABT8RGS2_9BACT|nr:TIGR02117 family protein [Rhodocytophaga aerolata]MDO1450549.1 TIGR02117 family protein [Rhodocytophaga aerolata]
MLKRTLKLTLTLILGLVGLLLVYLGTAFCLARIAVNKDAVKKQEVTIYILTNGVHTDLVLPIRNQVKDWSTSIKAEHTIGKDATANFIAFGWGDKGFYLETPTWADLKWSTAFCAAFGLSNSAIHTTFYKTITEDEHCKKIQISYHDYQKLVAYVEKSFKTSQQGQVIPIITKANYGNNDAFYEGVGSYSLFQTCNTWANTGLKVCGQKASLWTPFDKGIFYHYQ